jgi:uncharacterized repeat protein (TIGR04076 family)
MKDIELTPKELEFAVNLWGLSDEERKKILPNLTPYQKRFIRHWKDFFKYKIIQEVVWSKNCAEGAKPGDKFVYSAMGEFLPDESTFGCTFGMQVMLPFMYVVRDRICSGIDPSPMGIHYVRCIDTPPAQGGTGGSFFKVYCIKENVKVPPGIYRPGVEVA